MSRLPAAPQLLAAALIALSLAACDGDKEGTTITLNASTDDGNVSAGVNGGNGRVSIKAPGFSGQITLPKIQLDAGKFQMNGFNLYPGSKISGMNIDARDGEKEGEDRGQVRVTFESPAAPDTVRNWFEEKLSAADFKLSRRGGGLAGTDEEGKPFALELAPAGNGQTRGVITAGH